MGVISIHTWVASQRLNAGDLYYANIVGLFSLALFIKRALNSLTYEIGIELSIKENYCPCL